MSLLPVDDALKAITEALSPIDKEEISMADATAGDVMGRVLAEVVYAELSHPPHDVSAMDGFAVRHTDLADLSKPLKLIGESAAGHPFNGVVNSGEAVRIFTGGYCPKDCDTIIIQEDTECNGDQVTIKEAAPKGRYIRPQGNDFSQGDLIAAEGTPLSPRLLALIASAGVVTLKLSKKPRVAIISTGDELVAPGTSPKEGQIISSNGLFLKSYLNSIGAETIDIGIVPDQDDALEKAFEDAAKADLIITSGGASVGSHDGVAKAMTDQNTTQLNFWRIAMRPGKPLIFGKIKGVPMIGLPGNPVSTGVCAIVFVSTAIKAITGQDISHNWGLDIRQGRLSKPLKANDKRQDYLRASLNYGQDGVPELTPYEQQDSGMMKLLSQAEALVIRSPFADEADIGDPVSYIPIPQGI